jgi:hypothetical protein
MVNILRDQLDKAIDSENQAVRKVRNASDQLEAENRRLKDRVSEAAIKEEESSVRIRNQEKEIFALQEAVFKKDRALKEEQQQQGVIKEQVNIIRNEYEQQLQQTMETLQQERNHHEQIERKHEEEMHQLRQEVSLNVPKLVASALQTAEAQSRHQQGQQIVEITNQYEQQLLRIRQEMQEMQSYFSEKEARSKLSFTDERIELDKLRVQWKALQREKDDQDDQVAHLKKQLRNMESTISALDHQLQESQQHRPVSSNRWTGGKSNNSSMFTDLMNRSYDQRPSLHHEEFAAQRIDHSLNQSMERDALQYINQQLIEMKSQLQPSSSTSSKHDMQSSSFQHKEKTRRNVSFTPESLTETLAQKKLSSKPAHTINQMSGAAEASVQELIHDQFVTLPTQHKDTFDYPLWQRSGIADDESMMLPDQVGNRSAMMNESTSFMPETEAKEFQAEYSRTSFVARPPNSDNSHRTNHLPYGNTVASMTTRVRVENTLNNSSLNNSSSMLSMVSFLEPSMNGSNFEAIADGGYYEGYWKAKYQRSR